MATYGKKTGTRFSSMDSSFSANCIRFVPFQTYELRIPESCFSRMNFRKSAPIDGNAFVLAYVPIKMNRTSF